MKKPTEKKKRIFLKVEVDLPEFEEKDKNALQEIGTMEVTENGKHVLFEEVSLERFLEILDLLRNGMSSVLIQR